MDTAYIAGEANLMVKLHALIVTALCHAVWSMAGLEQLLHGLLTRFQLKAASMSVDSCTIKDDWEGHHASGLAGLASCVCRFMLMIMYMQP